MPGERLPQYANDFNQDDALALLLALKGNIDRHLHVATLCIITGLNGNICECKTFPASQKNGSGIIYALCIRKADRQIIENALQNNKHLFAVVIFTDLDGQPNHEMMLKSSKEEIVESNSTLHSVNNAVIAYLGDATDGTPIEELPIVEEENENAALK